MIHQNSPSTSFLIIALYALLLPFGCGTLGSRATPDWITGTSQDFPHDTYLTGIGEADSHNLAEQRAYAAVARVFSANVESQARDEEVYTQHNQHETSTSERTVRLDHLIEVSTKKVLENVHILDRWYRQHDRRHFALAGLERAKTARILRERISDYDVAISKNIGLTHEQTNSLAKFRTLFRARVDQTIRDSLNTDLQIIQRNGDGIPSSYTVGQLRQQIDAHVSKHFIVLVQVTGEQKFQLRTAIWDGLMRIGIRPTNNDSLESTQKESSEMTQEIDLLVRGTAKLRNLKLMDPLFTYVQWCNDIQLIDPSTEQVIGVIARSGKEGHITQVQARDRASRAMQAATSQEVTKSLETYLQNNVQNSVPVPSSACAEIP